MDMTVFCSLALFIAVSFTGIFAFALISYATDGYEDKPKFASMFRYAIIVAALWSIFYFLTHSNLSL